MKIDRDARIAVVRVTPELVVERIPLPPGSVIVGAEFVDDVGLIRLLIEHSDLELMPAGTEAPAANVQIQQIRATFTTTEKLEGSLHPLWSACVGRPGYDKAAWENVQRQLLALDQERRL